MSDHLEEGKQEAIKLLLSLPTEHPDAELSIAGIENQVIWLGFGWLVGRGLAAYRGGYSFRFLSEQTREVARNYLEA